MTAMETVRLRLLNQRLTGDALPDAGAAVKWLAAVQAQDYGGALWSLGLRTANARREDVEAAIAGKAVVRTWPMRGTLHFVASEDIRWMLRYLAVRNLSGSVGRRRQLGLDDDTLASAGGLLEGALGGGKALTRGELFEVFRKGGVSPDGQRGIHILSFHAQTGLLCFGPRKGKQPTFVLLEEWVPPAPVPPRDEALSSLALRYFTGHGPATLGDFVWWTGLTKTDAKRAVEAAGAGLLHEESDGKRRWTAPEAVGYRANPERLFLLPGYDEFFLGYADRSASLDPAVHEGKPWGGNGMFHPTIIVDGRVAGLWKRKPGKSSDRIDLELDPDRRVRLSADFARAAGRYGAFLGTPMELPPDFTNRSPI